MVKVFCSVFVMLTVCFLSTECAVESKDCTMGAGCFPSGQIPEGVNNTVSHYYCCLDKNFTRHSNQLPDNTYNCSCQFDDTIESKIENWADATKNDGRMCLRGADCGGSSGNNTINDKFLFCCWENYYNNILVTSHVTIFDGDKLEYIGCRCGNHSIPTTDPTGYIPPPVSGYNSSGESCHYDAQCNDRPSLECSNSVATFCCYGSRGIVTANEGNVTHCTCTNQMFGEQCEASPISILESEKFVPRQCTMGAACFPNWQLPDDIDSTSPGYYCCLDRNFTRHSNSSSPEQCSCQFDDTLDSKIQNWADDTNDDGRMCLRGEDCEGMSEKTILNSRFKVCCTERYVNNTVVTVDVINIDGDKEEFIGCRCDNHSVPAPGANTYIVPPVSGYNSTGESCFYDAQCDDSPALKCSNLGATFCCYGSRGIVTANGGQATNCTCTNEVFGEHCESHPTAVKDLEMPCLTACGNNTDKCSDGESERCCADNMVVVATKTFSSCKCKVRDAKDCDADTSSASQIVVPIVGPIFLAMASALYEIYSGY